MCDAITTTVVAATLLPAFYDVFFAVLFNYAYYYFFNSFELCATITITNQMQRAQQLSRVCAIYCLHRMKGEEGECERGQRITIKIVVAVNNNGLKWFV